MKIPSILDIGGVLISSELLTERFCCDIDACKGRCCVEGDAGAPLTIDEVGAIEDSLGAVWGSLSARAQSVIDRQGVAYCDAEGDLVTSIVSGRDCVFTCYEGDCCRCALERAHTAGTIAFRKPMSCALYPLREKHFDGGITALNYSRWDICDAAVRKGQELDMPLYVFLREPLTRRFGAEWYDELAEAARLLAAAR